MRTIGVAILAALTLSATATAGSETVRPSLRATSGTKLTIRGVGWAPGERVVLTLFAAGGKRVARTTAGAAGTFVVPFAYRPPRCSAWQARAIGTKSGVVWLRRPRIACASPD